MKSHSLTVFTLLFGAALLSLAGSLAFGFGYYSCVTPTGCDTYPPPGMSCEVVDESGGSSSAGDIQGSSDACAYVCGYEDNGWACGGAIPQDGPGNGCK
jgi:hypothetical protein